MLRRGGLLAVALAVLLAAFIYVPHFLVDISGGEALTPTEHVKALGEERRTLLAVLAAFGAAITLWYTHQRHQIDRAKQDLDRDANRTDRFTRAVDQLGDESKPAVQLGGVYALQRVANDSERDRTAALHVLAAFVRQTARAMPAPNEGNSAPTPVAPGWAGPPNEPVLAALGVLADEQANEGSTHLTFNLNGIQWAGVQLGGMSLEQAQLERADMRDADLARARLSEAAMREASLSGADLSRAELVKAWLPQARLDRADLRGSNLEGANLRGADLRAAKCGGTFFDHADMRGADLAGADLRGAYLRGARLAGASFEAADIDGANFEDAQLPARWPPPRGDAGS